MRLWWVERGGKQGDDDTACTVLFLCIHYLQVVARRDGSARHRSSLLSQLADTVVRAAAAVQKVAAGRNGIFGCGGFIGAQHAEGELGE